eukprot:Nk52_evm11s283 gene=Nk52_evmTU11s283
MAAPVDDASMSKSSLSRADQVSYKFATGSSLTDMPGYGMSVPNVVRGTLGETPIDTSHEGCVTVRSTSVEQAIEKKTEMVIDSNQLDTKMDLGGSAWGVDVSASSSLGMLDSSTSYTYKVTYMIKKTSVKTVDNCPVRPEVIKEYSAKQQSEIEKTKDWIAQYGVGYVREVTSGCMGLLDITYTFSDLQSSLDFSAKVDAKSSVPSFTASASTAYKKAHSDKKVQLSGKCKFLGVNKYCDFASIVDLNTGDIKLEPLIADFQKMDCSKSDAYVLSANTIGWATLTGARETLGLNLTMLQYDVSQTNMDNYKNAYFIAKQIDNELENCIDQVGEVAASCYKRNFFHESKDVIKKNFCELQNDVKKFITAIDEQSYVHLTNKKAVEYHTKVLELKQRHTKLRSVNTPIKVVFDYTVSDCSFNYGVFLKNISVYLFQDTIISCPSCEQPGLIDDRLIGRLGRLQGSFDLTGLVVQESNEGPFVQVNGGNVAQSTSLPRTYTTVDKSASSNDYCTIKVTVTSVEKQTYKQPPADTSSSIKVQSTTGGEKFKSMELDTSMSKPKMFMFTQSDNNQFEQTIAELPPHTALFVYRYDFGIKDDAYRLHPYFALNDNDGYQNVFLIGNGGETSMKDVDIGAVLGPWKKKLFPTSSKRVMASDMVGNIYTTSQSSLAASDGIADFFFSYK